MDCSKPGSSVFHYLLEFVQIHVHLVSDTIYLILILLPSIFSNIRVFSNESVFHIRWLEYWRFSFSIHHSNEYSGLIFFGIDWLDLLLVQGTCKSLLQHHNLKASVLQCSAFFMGIVLSKNCQSERSYIICFHLHNILKMAKLYRWRAN